MTYQVDPARVLDIVRCRKLTAANAARVFYGDGSSEVINADLLLYMVEAVRHPQAREFRERLIGPQPGQPML